MPKVHVFATLTQFSSATALKNFVVSKYNDDGIEVQGRFLQETGLTRHEPACIERVYSKEPKQLPELLSGVSYGMSWLPGFASEALFRAAICVYPPNILASPAQSSMAYLGAYEFTEWKFPVREW